MSKQQHEQHTLVRSLALGVLSGGRSSTPLAVLALNHDNKAVKGDWQQWKAFSTPLGRGLLVASAIGELIGDKSPKAPARISPMGLVGRIAAGAFAGAALGTTAVATCASRVRSSAASARSSAASSAGPPGSRSAAPVCRTPSARSPRTPPSSPARSRPSAAPERCSPVGREARGGPRPVPPVRPAGHGQGLSGPTRRA